jgi:hypothetical protein
VSENKPKTWPAKVRTTIQPETVLEVDESEWTTLHVQGLLVQPSPKESK